MSTAKTILKLSPLLMPFGVLFVGGFLVAVLQSFGYLLPIPWEHEHFYSAYAAAFTPAVLESLFMSLMVAFVSAFCSVWIGAVFAWGIFSLPQRLRPYTVVYKISLVLPHIAVGFVVLVLFSQSGFFSSVLYQLGVIKSAEGFPSFLYNGYGTGMILAYLYKEIPFVIMLVYAVLLRFDMKQVVVAKMLGASGPTIFFRIVLPHLRGVMNTAFIILFLFTFGAFDIPFLLGESRPAMLSIQVFSMYFEGELSERPLAMAILVMMFLFSAVFIMAYTHIASRLGKEGRKV
ncbi:MAG: ABC transporter permease [Desulfovibrio sp.]